MATVIVSRHSFKDSTYTNRLSNEGREAAYREGQYIASKYEGKKLDAKGSATGEEGSYIGRGADTSVHVLEGAGVVYDINKVVDRRLNSSLSESDIAAMRKAIKEAKDRGESMSSLEAALEVCESTVLSDVMNVADFVDSYVTGDDSEVYFAGTHSPTVEGLAYILTGDESALTTSASELSTVTITDSASGYTVTVDYLGGEQVTVESNSITEACESGLEAIAEGASEGGESSGGAE